MEEEAAASVEVAEAAEELELEEAEEEEVSEEVAAEQIGQVHRLCIPSSWCALVLATWWSRLAAARAADATRSSASSSSASPSSFRHSHATSRTTIE
jgi:hypothetical protein